MGVKLIAGAALFACLTGAAAAQQPGTIALRPGQQVSVQIADDGQVNVVSGTARSLSPDAQSALIEFMARFAAAGAGSNPAFVVGRSAPPPIAPNQIRISFLALEGQQGQQQRILLLENGYDRAVRYRAAIVRASVSQPTDVCIVPPKVPDLEHWPYAIEEIDLSAVSFLPAGEHVPACA